MMMSIFRFGLCWGLSEKRAVVKSYGIDKNVKSFDQMRSDFVCLISNL